MLTVVAKRLVWALRAFNAAIVNRWILHCVSNPITLNFGSAIVFAAHQDDETLGCGGMIALKRAAGVSVNVVFLTDGGGTRVSAERSISNLNDYRNLRRREALAATCVLGVPRDNVIFLDYPDGTLRRFGDQRKLAIISQLAGLILMHRPEEIYVPHRRDRHPDHEATFELVNQALLDTNLPARLFQYCIWLPWLSLLAPEVTACKSGRAYRLAIAKTCSEKRRAIFEYASQITNFPGGFLARFLLPFELFFGVN